MIDIQSSKDTRGFPISGVGIKDVVYPIKVLKKHIPLDFNVYSEVPAKISMYVDLPAEQKGTHMSRFVEILNAFPIISLVNINDILFTISNKLNSNSVHIEVSFDYLLEKFAPISKIKNILNYTCKYTGMYNVKSGYDKILEVNVPILTLCPCSKEISDHGAHNQRAIVKAQTRCKEDILWIEDLIALMESCGSAPIYSLLKRSDEKFITEYSYMHPCFVEDVVRQAAILLTQYKNISWFDIYVESFESIHNHSAVARIESKKLFNNKLV